MSNNLESVLRHNVTPYPIELSTGEVIGPRQPRFMGFNGHSVANLLRRDDFTSLCIYILYQCQELDEKFNKDTRWKNGRGFNKDDASPGAFYGAWVKGSKGHPDHVPYFFYRGEKIYLLTGRHFMNAKNMLHKYRNQLAAHFNRENEL